MTVIEWQWNRMARMVVTDSCSISVSLSVTVCLFSWTFCRCFHSTFSTWCLQSTTAHCCAFPECSRSVHNNINLRT